MTTTRERYLQWKNRLLLPQLPIEIWSHIFSYLEIYDLLSMRLVSRLFYSCVNRHTPFWLSVIFDIDQCPNYLIQPNLLNNVRSSNVNLFTKSNLYSHCNIYLKGQPLISSKNKRRKRRLLLSQQNDDESKKQLHLRCSSVHFESLRSFDQLQLECLLTKRVRHLELSYECLPTEPSLNFLLKIERLRYLKLIFMHNINELDSFSTMIVNTMHDIIILLFKLKSKMFPLQRALLINGFNLFGLCFVSFLGDCLCFGRPFSIYSPSNTYVRSLTDNLTHGLVSVFATSFLFGSTRRSLLIIALIAGSFVDIDHFIEVRSLSLYRALHDQPRDRPFLHNSLLLLIITFIIYTIELFLWRYQNTFYSIVFFLGWSTHHLRDAQRRGLTLSPLGQTLPIDHYLPIICISLIAMKLVHLFVFNTQSASYVKVLKSLILHNLNFIQAFPENVYFIEHLRSIWLEDCLNVHFLLDAIDKQSIKNVIVRRSTCDRTILTTFIDRLDTLHYLDLSSLQINRSTNYNDQQLNLPSKLKACSLNSTLLQFCSFMPHVSLRSLELIDINIDLLSIILKTLQSLKFLCLFFTTKNLSLSSMANYLHQSQYSQLWIHFHILSLEDYDEKQILPSNILIIPIKNVFTCFCYRNRIK
ncbi:unnamed protein product [Rotaria magnacalcarata]|uniref:Transmembrane protein 267 n=2 Tax=Rotaria magnacalcarata TaxID=392030 RepID=A0A816X9F5_9BILA|nr:unnamed protein product [Rotaria magnacalcarata]